MDAAALGQFLLELVSDAAPTSADNTAETIVEDFRKVLGPITQFFAKNPSSMPMKFHSIVSEVVMQVLVNPCGLSNCHPWHDHQ